ncbi:alpha/beta hydrolase [Acinetobacter sp. WCHAc010052]|nr:alpha/beta hydrolase [Acinetobacter sp. WCHAc010052]
MNRDESVKKLFLSVLGAVLISASPNITFAKPEIKPLAPNIAETGSEYYRFSIKTFESADKKRKYRVWLGIPTQLDALQQKEGYLYRSVFMLDGNAAMSHLDDQILKKLSERDAPVLVAIGYETNLPFETASRALDYTPADLKTGLPAADPRSPQRMSGGSSEFKKIITEKISPWVEQQIKLDPSRRALWGHSYGGLFVLDSLLTTAYFSHYFAASPSLSWAEQRMMQKIETTAVPFPEKKQLLLMEGDITAQAGTALSSNFDTSGINNNRKVLLKFKAQGLDAKFLIYPDLKHGEMFKASLLDVLLNRWM